MRTESESFIINPYIAGSPVKNPTMFFGREDVYAWLRQHLRGRYQDNIIVLYGERRSGKTSILYQMAERLGDHTYIPVLIDFQSMGLEGMDGFLWEVARKIVLGLRGVEGLPLLDRPSRRDFEENPRHQFEEVFLPPILAALGNLRLLLMFDETNRLEERINSGNLPYELVTYLRSLIQHSRSLNFLFSVGSRVEETEHLADLFNLAVYRKISFLEQDFVEDLITKPVSQHYTYTDAAIERIFELTSGQAYYTQLLCHNIFSYWTEHRVEEIDAEHVDLVLPAIIEQATPNLQFAWDDSGPVEKVILAAIAEKLPQYRAGVLRRNIESTLRENRLYPPRKDVTTGLKRLFERDIIENQEPYKFRVGFLQLWLAEFKRTEWIREEIEEEADEWYEREKKRRAEAPTTVETARRWAIPVLAGAIIGGLMAVIIFLNFPNNPPPESPEVDLLSTQVAALQKTATAVQVGAAEAESQGDEEEALLAQQTAAAAVAEVATVQAQVTLAIDAESTKIAAEINDALSQALAAQATATALQTDLDALENIIETATSTSTPIPTNTPTPVPPTSTNTPTPTPMPTNTPTPRPPTPTPTPQPQGRIAIPVDNGVGRYNVIVYSIPDGEIITRILNASQPSFSPDGTKLAVKAQREDGNTIWVYDANGGNGRLASPALNDSRPAWNASSDGLVYENRDTPKDGDSVWRISTQDTLSPDSSSVHLLAGDIIDADRPLYPLWAENDDLIFSACNYWLTSNGSLCGIWRTKSSATVDQDGFVSPSNITRNKEIPTDIDGDELLIMREVNSTWDVFVGSMNSGSFENLTDDSANDGLAVFSPDGKWIAFVSNRAGDWSLWVVPRDGGRARSLPIEGLRFGTDARNWTTERISWGP